MGTSTSKSLGSKQETTVRYCANCDALTSHIKIAPGIYKCLACGCIVKGVVEK